MLVFLFLSSVIVLSSAFPNGAPELGCYTSRPMHDMHMPQWMNASYILEFNPPRSKLTYVKGTPITLTLRSLHPDFYKLSGYLVTASSSSGLTGGKWDTMTVDSKSIPECGITQTSPSTQRTSVDLKFTPPVDIELETIQFKAIAVHNFSIFWDNILSPPLQLADTSANEIEMMIQQFASMAKLFNFSLGGNGSPDPSPTTPSAPPSNRNSRPSKSRRL